MGTIVRRAFLREVSQGVLLASLGPALFRDLGWSAVADASDEPSHASTLERLASLLTEMPSEKLNERIVAEWRSGTTLEALIAAGAIANARAFGGEDYVGYHAFMALGPALNMAHRQPKGLEPLPVMKVLGRNTRQMQKQPRKEPLTELSSASAAHSATELRGAVRAGDLAAAENLFGEMAMTSLEQTFDDMQLLTMDDINVHRVVLVWRAWDLIGLTGLEHARTLLRQSVRFCVDAERQRLRDGKPEPAVRATLVSLIDKYHLTNLPATKRSADEAWVAALAEKIHLGTREEGAELAAGALAEGFDWRDVTQAITLAANRLVLFDPGRPARWSAPETPAGSVHGASVGVHASDAAHAWRHIAAASTAMTAALCTVLNAYHTSGQQVADRSPHPSPQGIEEGAKVKREELLDALAEGIRANDQDRASALAARYGQEGLPMKPLEDLLQRFALDQDGALHAEKYLQTTLDEYAFLRPAHRWSELVGLARVCASGYGFAPAGMDGARDLLRSS